MSTAINSQVSVPPHSAATGRSAPIPVTDLLTVTTYTARPGTVVIMVCGEVDMFTAPLLRDRLRDQIRPCGPGLSVDLTDVGFLAVAGLTVLITARTAAIAAEIGFCLVADTPPVLRLLGITELHGVLACYPDLDHTPMRTQPLDVSGSAHLPAPVTSPGPSLPEPILPGRSFPWEHLTAGLLLLMPFLAVIAAVPPVRGWARASLHKGRVSA